MARNDMQTYRDGDSRPVTAYANAPSVPSGFWGAPVLTWQGNERNPDGLAQGDLYCPGFTGPTFAKNAHDFVVIGDYTTPGVAKVSASKARDYKINKSAGTDGANLVTHGIKLAEVQIELTIWTPQQLVELEKLWKIVFPGKTKTTKPKRVAGGLLAPNSTSTLASLAAHENSGGAFVGASASDSVLEEQPAASKTKVSTSNVAQPFTVMHPRLAFLDIRGLYFLEGTGPAEGSVPGARVFTMKCMEYMKPGKGDATKLADAAVAPRGSTLDDNAGRPPGSDPKNTAP